MLRTSKIFLLGMLICGTLVSVAAQQAEAVNPIQWSLKFDAARKTYRKPFTLQLKAQIKAGWHLYSLNEIPGGPRPTRVSLPNDQVFTLAGAIGQPVPISNFDENFGVETQFYEQAVTFSVPLKIVATAKPGKTKLRLQVRYQTCNDRLCLPPKTVKLETEVKLK